MESSNMLKQQSSIIKRGSSKILNQYANIPETQTNQELEDDIKKHLGDAPKFLREEEKELIKKTKPNYDDFNL